MVEDSAMDEDCGLKKKDRPGMLHETKDPGKGGRSLACMRVTHKDFISLCSSTFLSVASHHVGFFKASNADRR